MESAMVKSKATNWLGLACCLVGLGCYNTLKVENGGLVCGRNEACPDGFVCYNGGQPGQQGHCYRKGTEPVDGSVNGAVCAVGVPPFGPFASCSATVAYADSECDPVCQSGCQCNHRCVIDTQTYGSFMCEASAATGASFVQPMGGCDAPLSASCAPGSLCVADRVCPALCYKTCRADNDCPSGTFCSASGIVDRSGDSVPDLRLCTPPTESCDPTGAAACATPRAGFSCVFLAGMLGVATTDKTVCDCATLHSKRVGESCSTLPFPDDCQPGAVCVNGTCRSICSLRGSSTSCPNGGGCTALYGSSQYGYCR
jgi:hypothetical protein